MDFSRPYRPIRRSIIVGLVLVGPVLFAFYWLIQFLWSIQSEDKPNHLFALLDGAHKPTEPLWGVVAPAIGLIFPDRAFEAAIVIVYLSMLIGLVVCKIDWRLSLLIMFSPALIYLSVLALRQGLAVGIFLVAFGLASNLALRPQNRWWFVPLLATAVAALIHNSMVVAGLWVMLCGWLGHRRSSGAGFLVNIAAIAVSGLFLLISPAEHLSGFAVGFFLIQISFALAHHLFGLFPHVTGKVLVTLGVVVFGYAMTITGLRVVILLGLLLPLVFRTGSYRFQILALFLFPVADVLLLIG